MDLQAQFSKKTNIILMALSIIGLIAGTILILFSNSLFQIMFGLAENILHRSLNTEKWSATFYSFALIPIFAVIVVNAIIFVKYRPKTKIILLASLLTTIVFMIIMMHTKAANLVNSDDAGEMMLWRECAIAKSLLPTSWFYSTELRILNTQIFGVLFFSLFSDWTLIKTLVSLCSLAVLFFATLFLLDKIGIKEFWKKFICAILVTAPSSGLVWGMMTFANYYIPHAVISFFYVGLFVDLLNNGTKHKKAKIISFMLIAFLGGVASIRYILTIMFPFVLFTVGSELGKVDISKFSVKEFFLKNKFVFFSIAGLFAGCIGYLGNSMLHKFYRFGEYNTIRFGYLRDAKVFDIFSTVMELFGYRENVSVLTPNGVANICACVAIVLFVALLFEMRKTNMQAGQKILPCFFAVNFIFNTFIFLTVDFENRFFLPITVYIVPCVFVFIFNDSFDRIKRYLLALSICIVFLVSSLTVAQNIINSRETHRAQVAKFLEQNYTFGYAAFWDANVFTFLTNGKVDVGIIDDTRYENMRIITPKYKVYEWLSSKRYYTPDFKNDEKIFLLVTQDEFEDNRTHQIFKSGTQVYEDKFFRVFEYANHDAFRNGF